LIDETSATWPVEPRPFDQANAGVVKLGATPMRYGFISQLAARPLRRWKCKCAGTGRDNNDGWRRSRNAFELEAASGVYAAPAVWFIEIR
jgi:hypothetical protein